MKVAISADGKGLESTVHQRFGRCPFFLLVETDDMTVDVLENRHADLSTGAGIQAAGMLVSNGAKAVITGNCGPKAMQVFAETGVPAILNQHGVIREVVEKFKNGSLAPSTQVNDPAPPTAAGRGGGGGLGGGRGMGGCGRGRGLGGGRGMGPRCSGTGVAAGAPYEQPSGALSKQDERLRLRQQADACKQQLAEIEARIKTLS